MDEIIDRELQGLRNPVESTHGVGDAIMAMQSAPKAKGWSSLKWSIGIGSVAVAVGAIIFVGSLATTKAYARELHEISAAQLGQQTMIMKCANYQGHATPDWTTEWYLDHNRQASYEYRDQGKLHNVDISDGIRRFTYGAGSWMPNGYVAKPYAQIDQDNSEHFTIETVDSYLNSDYFKTRKIEKQTDVDLNGRICDLYLLANGSYRIWVDKATRLPIQREIYNKGVTLWERDTYEYPATMPEAKFQEPTIPGITPFDYIAARKTVVDSFSQPGQIQTVGGVTISLKAVVKDENQIAALWTTSGLDERTNAVNLQVKGAQNQDTLGQVVESNLTSPDRTILNARLRLIYGQPFKLPTTVKIAAWSGDNGKLDKDGKPVKKLVGWATFTVDKVIEAPHIEQILNRPKRGNGEGIALNTTKKG
jgi:hypothetical protein